MARVTSKRQLTIPKAIADRYGIAAGDDVELIPAGDSIRIELQTPQAMGLDRDQRLALFDRATERQRERTQLVDATGDRGWRRDDLYERGSAR